MTIKYSLAENYISAHLREMAVSYSFKNAVRGEEAEACILKVTELDRQIANTIVFQSTLPRGE